MQETGQHPIVPTNIEDEMSDSYLDYSMSVIVGRALPDARDGLKPVHRRIIYAMHDEGLTAGRAHSKCAGVVGEVLKKYHPHGDSAVYDSLVRMAQPWNLRYPLIDGQGNFGSVDGDAAAAYRYTECRLSRIAETLLTDIDKNTVEFIPNFDGRVNEPTVLPAAFPNLLVNGSAGIAVGMATNIPPHNLSEVIDALQIMIKNPEATIAELMQALTGPDFPTGGYIYGRAGIRDAYATGRGKLKLRARVAIEQIKGGREAIIVTEIPYQVNKSRLMLDIANLIRDKKVEGVSDLRDESDRDGMRIVLELKRGEVAQVIINNLYKLTQLQTSFGIIMLALVDGRPRYLTLDRMLSVYLDHRRQIIVRRTRFELEKAHKRLHIVEGLRIAVSNIDDIIALIRKSESTEEARQKLKKNYDLSEEQAKEILDMPLRRLTGLEREKLEKEHEDLVKLIRELTAILADPKMVTKLISMELDEIKKKFGDPRATEILDATEDLTIEDLIAEERMVITVSHEGYIKRTATSVYRSQKRGGKGNNGMTTKEQDWVEHLFVGTTHEYLLFFTNKGKAYWLKVYELPQAGRATRGRPIINLLELDKGEKVMALIPVRDFEEERFLVMGTRKGQVVRNKLSLYSNPRRTGIKAINVAEDDELIGVKMSSGAQEIFIGTTLGRAIRFSEGSVRPTGRFSSGVRGVRLKPNDQVVGLEVLREGSSILTVCANGYGKRTLATEYRQTNRGGVGVINIRATERNGRVIAILEVFDTDEVMLISEQGKSIRSGVKQMRMISRATQGVRVIRLDSGDMLTAMARIEEDDSVKVEDEAEGPGSE